MKKLKNILYSICIIALLVPVNMILLELGMWPVALLANGIALSPLLVYPTLILLDKTSILNKINTSNTKQNLDIDNNINSNTLNYNKELRYAQDRKKLNNNVQLRYVEDRKRFDMYNPITTIYQKEDKPRQLVKRINHNKQK